MYGACSATSQCNSRHCLQCIKYTILIVVQNHACEIGNLYPTRCDLLRDSMWPNAEWNLQVNQPEWDMTFIFYKRFFVSQTLFTLTLHVRYTNCITHPYISQKMQDLRVPWCIFHCHVPNTDAFLVKVNLVLVKHEINPIGDHAQWVQCWTGA